VKKKSGQGGAQPPTKPTTQTDGGLYLRLMKKKAGENDAQPKLKNPFTAFKGRGLKV